MLVDAARDQRVREALRAGRVVRGDARVERAEVRQRMELEAASGEVAVDEAVVVGDVRLRPRRVVLGEVVVVRLELSDEGERPWRRQPTAERRELFERDGNVLAAAARQRANEVCCTRDLGPAGVRGRTVDPSCRRVRRESLSARRPAREPAVWPVLRRQPSAQPRGR